MPAENAIAAPVAPSPLVTFARDIKLSHTVFALPFAILSAFLAAGGWPGAGKLGLILVCMVCARTVAMSANRLLDAKLDALNPRTRGRAIPSGRLSRGFFLGAITLAAAGFIAACALFHVLYQNSWPLLLCVPALLFVSAYPLLKRFTRLSHYYLGAALALAPLCAWIAVRPSIAWPPVIMAAAVLTWTAGFDIIYACQDFQSDVATGLHSVPAKLGIGPALAVARLTHALCLGLLVLLALSTSALGTLFFIGVALTGLLMVIEHSLVRKDDLSRVNLAFFTFNGLISVTLGGLGVADVLLRH